jgi:hypothetical protein
LVAQTALLTSGPAGYRGNECDGHSIELLWMAAVEKDVAINIVFYLSRDTTMKPPQRAYQKRAERTDKNTFNLTAPIRVRSPTVGIKIDTLEKALKFIDRSVPDELSKLPRWTFARALLVQAMRTGKSRDLNTAVRQLKQALRNESWLIE